MTPKGTLLLIGGAEDKGNGDNAMKGKNASFQKFEILKELIPIKSNINKKRIEIISTASDVPDEMNKTYAAAFEKIGYRDIGFINIENKQEARNSDYHKRIQMSHAVFLTVVANLNFLLY